MKITASKRDDILKRKAEYEKKLARYDVRVDELEPQFEFAAPSN